MRSDQIESGKKRAYFIPLTQGQYARVDAEDWAWLMQFKWCLARRKNGKCCTTACDIDKGEPSPFRLPD